ncbi:MAG: prepilin-type N-terminal cleavage/methylation domain-containing protein [Phycisphaerae bacterium]|nr:prepilin-type N-terminal cleavage/methylation domain-containing protein [Phycisphaerae bacterium]
MPATAVLSQACLPTAGMAGPPSQTTGRRSSHGTHQTDCDALPGLRRTKRPPAGFSLVEIMLAAMILGIGFVMLLPAFTVGLNESRLSVDNSVGVQLAQNADAYCQTLLKPTDGNWWNGANVINADGAIHVYQFGLADAIANEAGIRIHGDATKSRYYWNLLYRIAAGETSPPHQVELWILVCKRDGTGPVTNGLMTPILGGVSGTQGPNSFTGSGAALELETWLVTDQGEVLMVQNRKDGGIGAVNAFTYTFGNAYYVPLAAGGVNACVYAVHSRKGF